MRRSLIFNLHAFQPYATAPPKPPSQQWMVMPVGVVGCPPGLEYLSQIDQVLVHQQVELFEGVLYKQTSQNLKILKIIVIQLLPHETAMVRDYGALEPD